MTDNVKTLRPGLLVSLNTSVRGNVAYQKVELEGAHVNEDGEQTARWETTRVITDLAEHEAAAKIRGTIRTMITRQCAVSAFGLLCPEQNAASLREAIAEARDMADAFNDGAQLTRISVNVLYGRIAADDVEAIRAIASEIRSLMDDMESGLKSLDVKAVRDAAQKAKGIGDMLSPDAKGRLDVAITAARSAARKIVKAGDEVAIEVDRFTLAKIDMARSSFLDLDEAEPVQAPEFEGRAIDLGGDPVGTMAAGAGA